MKLKSKGMWAKCILKSNFTGGISTTSRIEGLHAKQKKYMISNTSLQGIFNGFRLIEKTNVSKFKAEFSKCEKQTKNESRIVLNEIKEICSEYIY